MENRKAFHKIGLFLVMILLFIAGSLILYSSWTFINANPYNIGGAFLRLFVGAVLLIGGGFTLKLLFI